MSLIETRNLFVNTEQTLIGECRNVGLNLPQYLLQCAENQRMRLTLNSFSMRKNWYAINKYNNTFFVVFKSNDLVPIVTYSKVTIPQGNYQSFTDQTYGLAKAIEDALDSVLKTQFLITTPNTSVTWNYVTNKFTISFATTGATAGKLAFCKLVTFTIPDYSQATIPSSLIQEIIGSDVIASFQDNFEIMGGCNEERNTLEPLGNARDLQFDGLVAMFDVASTGGNNPTYTMTSFYNASLNSEEAIYLRTDLNSTSFQTSGFDSGSQLFPYIVNSQILAKIPLNNAISVFVQESGSSVTDEGTPVTSTSTADYRYERPYELVQYTDNGNNIYSIILLSKKINSMRLFVTDSYGRLLPEISQQQINCDGMNFTASLRVDVFQD
jgi:hypothetical protein